LLQGAKGHDEQEGMIEEKQRCKLIK